MSRIIVITLVAPLLLICSATRVCVTLDSGFDMLLDPTMPIAGVTRESQLSGFNVDARLHILPSILSNTSYELRVLGSYGELMVATRRDECDVAWAAYFQTANRDRCGDTVQNRDTCRPLSEWTESSSWTPWRCCVDFSPPFMTYGLAIMYEVYYPTFMETLVQSVTAPFAINFGCFTFILLTIFAHFLWVAERKVNPDHFPTRYLDGIDDAVWWAIVTLTTVGYGDKVPITGFGRVLAILWMLTGLCLCSILIGYMSDTFSEIQSGTATLNTVRDMVAEDYMVCSYPTSFNSGEILSAVPPANRKEGSGMAECAEWMETRGPDDKFAIVLDAPVMKHFRSITPWARTMHISNDINTYLVTIVYPEGGGSMGRSLSDKLNPAVVDFYYSGHHTQLVDRWFPADGANSVGTDVIQWGIVGLALGLLIAYVIVMVLATYVPKPDTVALKAVSSSARGLQRRLSQKTNLAAELAATETPTTIYPSESSEDMGTPQSSKGTPYEVRHRARPLPALVRPPVRVPFLSHLPFVLASVVGSRMAYPSRFVCSLPATVAFLPPHRRSTPLWPRKKRR